MKKKDIFKAIELAPLKTMQGCPLSTLINQRMVLILQFTPFEGCMNLKCCVIVIYWISHSILLSHGIWRKLFISHAPGVNNSYLFDATRKGLKSMLFSIHYISKFSNSSFTNHFSQHVQKHYLDSLIAGLLTSPN